MKTARELIKQVADTVLAGSRYRQYKIGVEDGTIHHNMLGGEVAPKLHKGVILHHEDGWYIQKTGVNAFVAHKAELLPVLLNVGDKVEIQHGGFAGTSSIESDEAGMGFRSTTISRRRLVPPKKHPVLNDMSDQLSEMKLPDGRRGLHLLSDLKFANFRGDASDNYEFNPYLEFEVQGAKFTGTVRFEYIYGMDTYELDFKATSGESAKYENVVFVEVLPHIEAHCDSSLARLATVNVLSRAKKKEVPAVQAPSM